MKKFIMIQFIVLLAAFLAMPASASQLLNISSRVVIHDFEGGPVGGEVAIGGFIVSGTEPKRVAVRALGPSEPSSDFFSHLEDPILELHKPDGTVVTNDNWRDTQEQEIIDEEIAPLEDLESTLIDTLEPGEYTFVVRCAENPGNVGGGLTLVETYDLDPAADSRLANISARGAAGVNPDSGLGAPIIGGFIIGPDGSGDSTVLMRGLGPSLAAFGIDPTLADPTLQLVNEDGTMVLQNDNWRDDQEAEIEATGIPPEDDAEAAIVASLTPGLYTVLLNGLDDTILDGGFGVGLIEIYHLP